MYTERENKEIKFLYDKHNRSTEYKLDVSSVEIIFPKNITKILNKKIKRTEREKIILEKFRKRILKELADKSAELEMIAIIEKEKRNKEITDKIKATKEENNQLNPEKIKHFGLWFDKKTSLSINRENYAIVDRNVHFPDMRAFYEKYPDKRNMIFDDETCTTYREEWCESQRAKCLKNFDLNMAYFEKIDREKFENALEKFLALKKGFTQIVDLNECRNISGIYVLVLDKYKQIYIGQSGNIKKRIQSHWSKRKEFDRLIYGDENKSILSIDSFGCLDTTRIFIYKTDGVQKFELEEWFVNKMDDAFMLNRTAGGISGGNRLSQLQVAANSKYRNL